ncbi:hypothetical protein EC912_10543 [Luteibacter rhizovicinus]|uniref:Lipoprotein n=1 Tax=Luteibacter rhizovicinus TaxID=242606 RepID=A0A4R3YQI0_9GAMM|nr:hypothetical protein [Luteibacter rhizovicinus]TCV93183.1 hypothetical protein EC912_10543 [Luteibacter rhizovicinus]
MKKLMLAASVLMLSVVLSGCVVVAPRGGYYHHGYWDHGYGWRR